MGAPKKQKVERTNTIPSSPADRAKLRGFIKEAVANKTMQAGQRDAFKSIKDDCLDEFAITGKLFGQLVRFEYNQNFQIVSGESQEIFDSYEQLTANTGVQVE